VRATAWLEEGSVRRTREELIRGAARQLGFERVSTRIRETRSAEAHERVGIRKYVADYHLGLAEDHERYDSLYQEILLVGRNFENIGNMVRNGLTDERIFIGQRSPLVVTAWNAIEPLLRIRRAAERADYAPGAGLRKRVPPIRAASRGFFRRTLSWSANRSEDDVGDIQSASRLLAILLWRRPAADRCNSKETPPRYGAASAARQALAGAAYRPERAASLGVLAQPATPPVTVLLKRRSRRARFF